MKINLDGFAKDLDGKEIPGVDKKPFTLASICVEALLGDHHTDQASGLVKYERSKLADRINKGGDVEISVEELAMLKEMVGKMCKTIFIKNIYDQIESASS